MLEATQMPDIRELVLKNNSALRQWNIARSLKSDSWKCLRMRENAYNMLS